jgi:predicted nucleic acid-binding protein
MVIDASVWVAVFRAGDVQHETSLAFLETALARGAELQVPNFALVEVAGVFARQSATGTAARRTVRALTALPGLQQHDLDDGLAEKASAMAVRCRLRGADAVYVALASHLRVPLITLDAEILDRARRVVRALTPEGWLRSQRAPSR